MGNLYGVNQHMDDEYEGITTGCRNLKELLTKYQAGSSKHLRNGLTVIRKGKESLYFGWNNYHGQYVQTVETE
jgi:hypothetical protein